MRGWLVLVVIAVSAVAAADPAGEPEQHAVCLLGNRGPSCTTVLLAEVDGRYGQHRVFAVTAQAGLLVNSGAVAWGLSAGVLDWSRGASGDQDHLERIGVVAELRGRLWLGDRTGLDVGLGGGNVGGVADVALEYRDIIGISAGGLLYSDGNTTGVSANVGLRLSLWALLAIAGR